MACNEQNFFFEAADAYFGIAHCREIEVVEEAGMSADEDFDLNGFELASGPTDPYIKESVGYIFKGTDPAYSGKTGLEVTFAGGETAEEVAQAYADAINNDSGFSKIFKASTNGIALQIENKIFGGPTTENVTNSSFTHSIDKQGNGGFLGRTADAIEVTLTTNGEPVQTNQGASNKEDEIYTGADASASLNLVELTADRFKTLMSVVGETVTLNSKEITGVGESKLFESLSAGGGRLVLHPTRLDNNDRSRDFSFHKSAPKPQTLGFDGTALQQFNVDFAAYLDRSIDKKVNLYTIKQDWAELIGAV